MTLHIHMYIHCLSWIVCIMIILECSEPEVICNVAYGAVKADTDLDGEYEVVSLSRPPPSMPLPAQQPAAEEAVYRLYMN